MAEEVSSNKENDKRKLGPSRIKKQHEFYNFSQEIEEEESISYEAC